MALLCHISWQECLPWDDGGTVKRLAARASLQRAVSDQILTPKQLFEFTAQEIEVVSGFYIDTNTQ